MSSWKIIPFKSLLKPFANNREKSQHTKPYYDWFTNIQWNLSFGTPLFSGNKIWSRKTVHTTFVFVTSIEGTPLFRGKGHFLRVPKPGFNLHLCQGDTLALKKLLTTKIIDKFKCTLVTMATTFKNLTISLKSMYGTFGNSTHNMAKIT